MTKVTQKGSGQRFVVQVQPNVRAKLQRVSKRAGIAMSTIVEYLVLHSDEAELIARAKAGEIKDRIPGRPKVDLARLSRSKSRTKVGGS